MDDICQIKSSRLTVVCEDQVPASSRYWLDWTFPPKEKRSTNFSYLMGFSLDCITSSFRRQPIIVIDNQSIPKLNCILGHPFLLYRHWNERIKANRMVLFHTIQILLQVSDRTKQHLFLIPIQKIRKRWGNKLLKSSIRYWRVLGIGHKFWNKRESDFIWKAIGAFLSDQSDRIEILFGLQSFLALQKLISAIGLAMFCKQRRFGTLRTVHHTKSWLKLLFYRSIRIYGVDFEKMYISSMLFFFFFFFFLERQYAVRGRKKAETYLRLRVQNQCRKIRHLNEI